MQLECRLLLSPVCLRFTLLLPAHTIPQKPQSQSETKVLPGHFPPLHLYTFALVLAVLGPGPAESRCSTQTSGIRDGAQLPTQLEPQPSQPGRGTVSVAGP
ncbi:hypothetical protein NQZ68_034810 [Dissostichus eleginoides]|nr:hypothetical protein NQZ68_034810 [Dissostichus eleginoides]